MTSLQLNALRYDIVPHTRGAVLQLGGEKKLYEHFSHSPDGAWDDVADDAEPVLDALVMMGDVPAGEVPRLMRALKTGGHLVRPGPTIERKESDGGVTLIDSKRSGKTACLVRYGGFGDQIMASSVIPGLKRAGFHVTFMTTPKGHDILKHDPHIDAWLIQDDAQVPNLELGAFWDHWSKKFDRFVNLSESVEGTLLAVPGRMNHTWPKEVRDKYLDVNYLEFAHDLAQVPYKSESKFYPSAEETTWAEQYWKDHAGDGFRILWALAGSSPHKFTPFQDVIIARILLEMPEARMVLCGDDACRILEAGWESEPRIKLTSGELSIRQTLTLAKYASVVIAPETGVANAVAFEAMGKVIFLSHSSKNNLTKHWKNTVTLEPMGQSCFPCRRLHYSREFCPEDKETGAAMCQTKIAPDRAFDGVMKHYADWKKIRPSKALVGKRQEPKIRLLARAMQRALQPVQEP